MRRWEELSFGQWIAIGTKLGGIEKVEGILRDELEVEVREAIRLLVAQTGRCIPELLDLTNRVGDENRSFSVQPLDGYSYIEILAWYKDILPKGSKLLEVAEFEDIAETSREAILADRQIANLFRRAAFPVPFSKFSFSDLGTALEDFFLPIAERGYKAKFPDREFCNYRKGKLAGQVTLLPFLGGERLFAGMGMMWFFPHSLQRFSPLAQREAMAVLTKHGLGLADPSAFALAIGGFPEQLAGSYQTPGYNCSAVSCESPDFSLYFKAHDDSLVFNDFGNLEYPDEVYSGGLFFLGQPRK